MRKALVMKCSKLKCWSSNGQLLWSTAARLLSPLTAEGEEPRMMDRQTDICDRKTGRTLDKGMNTASLRDGGLYFICRLYYQSN